MIDFRLKVFYAVATNLSFTKASNELFVTQPAITKQIQALEKEYGLQLFKRKGNRICLTLAGKELLNYTKEVFELNKKFQDKLNFFREYNIGELKLGASTTIAQYIFPPILSGFNKKYPHIKLSLLSGNSVQIADALIKGEIDLGLVEGKIKNHEIKYEIFIKDELVLSTSSKNKILSNGSITLNRLKKLPLVLREKGSGTLEVFEYALKSKKKKLSDLNIVMYLGSTEAIKYYLEDNESFGFLSVRAIQKELANNQLTIKKVNGLKVTRTFDFISLRGSTSTEIVTLFRKYSKQFYNQK